MTSDPIPSCAQRVFDITGALCRAMMNAIRPGFIDAVMAMVIYRRIMAVRGRLLALEARFLAGLPSTGGRRTGLSAVTEQRAAPVLRHGDVRLPRRFAWLCVLVPGEAACFAGQLRVVLAEPGMVALLASCPQAVRVVRPLCWMLGIARADYVPGSRVEPALLAAPAQGAVPVSVVEPRVAETADAWVGHVTAGMGWVRFIPG